MTLPSNTILLVIFCFFIQLGEQRCANSDFSKDSANIKTHLLAAQKDATTNFLNALTHAKKALHLAQLLQNTDFLFDTYRMLGRIHEENNYLVEAYSWYDKVLQMQDYLSYNDKLDIYLDWAIVNKKLSNYDTTKEYYQKALNLANTINDSEMKGYVYTGLGTLNSSIGEFDKALEYLVLAKQEAEKRQNTEGVILAETNIAKVYLQAKKYKSAYLHLQKSYDSVIKTKDSVYLDYVLNAYGQILNAEEKYQEAIVYHQKALKYCEKKDDKWMIARTLGFMADVYTQLGQYNMAEIHFNRCFEYSTFLDFQEHPKLLTSLAYLYLKTNQISKARDYFYKSLILSNKRGFKAQTLKSNIGLTEVYEKMGNYDAALKHRLIAETYKDSIFNEDKTRKIAEIQFKYNNEKTEIEDRTNLEKSEKEIQALQLSQNRTRLILLSILLLSVVSLSSIFYFIKQKNRNNAILAQKNAEMQLKNERLEKSNKILKQFAYASAHDLKEPLRSIGSFVSVINKRYAKLLPTEASQYINFVISGVKRMESLISALLEYSTIASDVEDVKGHVALSDILSEVQFKLGTIISEKNAIIDVIGDLPMLQMTRLHATQLFQNLLNNALKFNDKTPIIQINGQLEKDHYAITIKDNGIGMKKEYSDKIFRLFQKLNSTSQYEGMGIGLAICKQIIEKYDGTIGFESVEKEGTVFNITLPITMIESPLVANLSATKNMVVENKFATTH
jgi:signal transduction histidine kinase